ncbi:MAG: DAK2 domain-containing protein [Actinomycetales bacterium]
MTALDVAAARAWVGLALERLGSLAGTIDALNVFPVADGDTGTNLLLTMRRAAVEATNAPDGIAELSGALARGALLGARGNSGIITAQVLAGCSAAFADANGEADGRMLAGALITADAQAWEAVELPVEGTVLSVTRAVSCELQALLDTDPDPAAVTVAGRARDTARAALALTTHQLPTLGEAGVVDAGAAGYVVLLDALYEVLSGDRHEPLPGVEDRPDGCGPAATQGPVHGPAFEVMYLLRGALTATMPEAGPGDPSGDRDRAVVGLRRELGRLGESVAVVSTGDTLNVHVHTDDPEAAVLLPSRLGLLAVPTQVRVVHLPTGVQRAVSGAPSPVPGQTHPVEFVGCVARASGPGLAAVLADAGATPVVTAAARRISTEELLDAITATRCRRVIVLPNDADSLPVARAAARRAGEDGLQVRVIETVAEVQGLAAVALFTSSVPDATGLSLQEAPGDGFEQVVAAMRAAAEATRYGAVALAARAADTPGGPCSPGDALGLVGGTIVRVGPQVSAMVRLVVRDLAVAGPPELVTVVLGVGAPGGLEDVVRAELGEVEVQVIAGGQLTYPVLLGVE